ncbi:low temperature requirement protein A [Nonomuraea sp. NPDC050556]|uniref:low temperature requirement protein A n=1 Tax=Nonomuraea sp. NPDC050556 TaxID=3364369 RepID=UPI0037B32EE0
MITNPGRTWQPPRLRLFEDGQRRATWLELFYDLVFVVAVAELAGVLADGNVGGYVGLFIPIWWAWGGYVFYANRFDTDDVSHRLLVTAQILAVSLMAASIGDIQGRSALFAVAYTLVRLLLIVAYIRVARSIPEARALAVSYATGFSIAVVFWLGSLALPLPQRYLLWGVAIVIDLATPFVSRRFQHALPPQSEHLPERFGLLVVIVLGEVVASIIMGLKDHPITPVTLLIALAGIVGAVAAWWAYFDHIDETVVLRTQMAGQVWTYSHLPLAMALVAFGVGVEQLIVHPGATAWWIIAAAVAGVALSLAAQRISARKPS